MVPEAEPGDLQAGPAEVSAAPWRRDLSTAPTARLQVSAAATGRRAQRPAGSREGPDACELGLNLGYWGAGNDADNLALAQEADRLGYSVVWAAEAYGSDAATVLAWVAAQTERIDVGSAIFQIPAAPRR